MKQEIKLVNHHGKLRIVIYAERNSIIINEVREIAGARWSNSLRAWHLPDNIVLRKRFGIALNGPNERVADHETKVLLNKLVDWMEQRRYSHQTVQVYCKVLQVYFNFYKEKDPRELTNNDVYEFNTRYIIKNSLSITYQSQFINALKLFYEHIIRGKMDLDKLERPRKEFRLPVILHEEEVVNILDATRNEKHRCMLSLIYSAGLRRGEMLNLKLEDIDSKRMLIHIKKGKGAKDRVVPLSAQILTLLRSYFIQYKPKVYLFEGQFGGRYSERSIEQVFQRAKEKAGIKKDATLHTLRHSYATHLLEGGTHLRVIQELLGHKSSKTTQIYTHVSREQIGKVISPFDKLPPSTKNNPNTKSQ